MKLETACLKMPKFRWNFFDRPTATETILWFSGDVTEISKVAGLPGAQLVAECLQGMNGHAQM